MKKFVEMMKKLWTKVVWTILELRIIYGPEFEGENKAFNRWKKFAASAGIEMNIHEADVEFGVTDMF